MLSRGRKALLSAAASTLAASLVLFGATGAANADPVAAASGDQTVAQAAATLDQLEAQVGMLEEQYAQAKLTQDAAQKRATALQADVTAQQAKVDALRAQVATFARASFQNAGVDTTTQLFTSGDPDNFLQQISTVAKVGENMNDTLLKYQSEQANLADLKRASEAEVAKAAAAVQQQADATDQAKAKAAEQQAVLDRLTAEQQAQVLAATTADTTATPAAAAAAAPQAAAAPAAAAATATPKAPAPAAASAPTSVGNGGSSIGRAAAAYAISKVGSAYVWGATGPNAFDCSGLMVAAYRSAGMSIDHSAAGLAGTGRYVAKSDLQPGDLIFWYSPIHHVGMYVGNGMMVHARNPRIGVVMQSVDSYINMGAPYTTARRLVG